MIALDGNVVDMASIAMGLLLGAVRPYRRWRSNVMPFFKRDKLINDILNGTMVVPFGLMLLSPFSQGINDLLMQSAKVTVSLGGAVGLTFVVAELFRNKS